MSIRKLYIAADHGGFALKENLKKSLSQKGYELLDLGTDSTDSSDYPDYAHKLAEKVAREKTAQGILVCGTGIGMAMTANRHSGVRAALVTTPFMAEMAKKHNNANILCLGGRVLSDKQALELVETWLKTEYEGGRHDRRLQKLEKS